MKTFDLLCAIDNWLVLIGGKGLTRYIDERWSDRNAKDPIKHTLSGDTSPTHHNHTEHAWRQCE